MESISGRIGESFLCVVSVAGADICDQYRTYLIGYTEKLLSKLRNFVSGGLSCHAL